jgi:hypothetical protein|tara:strand:- start:941 stop:1117 length:177 start_codon:yes stop_codon:yes gene_type:complete
MILNKEEINAIISIAQKIIKHEEDKKFKTNVKEMIRESEDVVDYEGARAPEKCEDCND